MTSRALACHELWCWAGGELQSAQWGDELVLYHEPTASTHLLDAEMGPVVAALKAAGHAMMTADIWQQAFGESPQTEDCVALSESLAALANVGLLNRTPP